MSSTMVEMPGSVLPVEVLPPPEQSEAVLSEVERETFNTITAELEELPTVAPAEMKGLNIEVQRKTSPNDGLYSGSPG